MVLFLFVCHIEIFYVAYGLAKLMVNKTKKINIGFVLLLAIICGFLYYPALFAGYVWDDTILFSSRTELQNGVLSWELISQPVLPNTIYFRPFVFLMWYIEFHLFGQKSFVSHFIGLVIFYINCLLIYTLSYLCAVRLHKVKPYYYAIAAALIYLLHPSLTETTAWVSGRFDQYCTLFVLLGLVVFISGFRGINTPLHWGVILTTSACFLFALLSKELGVIFPLLLLFFYMALVFENQDISSYTYTILIINFIRYQYLLVTSFGVVFLFYLLLRIPALSEVHYDGINKNYIQGYIIQGMIPFHAIKYYILQIFLPATQISLIHPLNEIDQSIKGKMTAIISSISVLTLLIYTLIKKTSFSAWMFFATFVSLFLVLYFFPLGLSGNLGHSRFLTLPLAFVSIAITFLPYLKIGKFLPVRVSLLKFISISIIGLWVLLSVFTIRSVLPFWQNEYSLWTWAYKQHPNSELARYNYLTGALSKHKYAEVINFGQKYIKKHGGLEVQDQLAYANALMNVGDPESMNYYAGAIEIIPKFHEMQDGDARKNVDRFAMNASQIGDAYATYAVGLIIFENNLEKAIYYLNIATWYMIPDQRDRINLYMAAALYLKGSEQEAIQIYKKQKARSIALKQDDYGLTRNLLNIYCQKDFAIGNVECTKLKNSNSFL